jgi:hypothetical protein
VTSTKHASSLLVGKKHPIFLFWPRAHETITSS